jgi:uncharacterized protein YkwD
MTDHPARFARGSRRLAAPVLLAALLLAPAAGAQDFELACPADEELRVVELINQERAARGLGPLALDVRLGAAALRHSEDMADGCFLSHGGSDGSNPGSRVRDAGYSDYAGEVAGAGQRTPEVIVDGWMNSPGHYAIIMGSGSRHIGVGHVSRPACQLQGYGFNVSDFWTANLGYDSAAPFGEEEHCSDAPLAAAHCDDGVDNDGDGLVDFMGDWGCSSAEDVSELPACADGLDNDGDGLVDYPDDPQCLAAFQRWENGAGCGLGAELALLLPPLLWLRRRRA